MKARIVKRGTRKHDRPQSPCTSIPEPQRGNMFAIQDVSDLALAFPARIAHLMPSMGSIPAEFKRGDNEWCRLFSDWFFRGLSELTLTPKPGVDRDKALRHIRAVMSSYEPGHEHKEAAVAYLLSQWFEPGATWKAGK